MEQGRDNTDWIQRSLRESQVRRFLCTLEHRTDTRDLTYSEVLQRLQDLLAQEQAQMVVQWPSP